ncbi:MAG: twin-arginine translocation signal domain-containing protein, partial [Gemmatimonadetes bacterium]|nr:twin-arginine translocation signal domain-containing protein [Gemmatimonadota bacterium]NIR76973.1 twin-arginine translocation signal domain-containing protein [Gemmatimonadota bacterium]NIT85500.1 twin-arginine translocation signal domain-containing protein [Gemmatimonadota bacterium]NIU29324.1 twin-arginine translocation signal domain-containing protein [Gemmatimonadota bacterium]NIU34394.1 twin-arginine translocation signal domain-containing protein [Gemmatimonadota bacterium]
MKRRDFLRFGAAVAGAPAVLPLIDLREPDRP